MQPDRLRTTESDVANDQKGVAAARLLSQLGYEWNGHCWGGTPHGAGQKNRYILGMTRPMNDRGQGRKPISPTGELMKPRQIRMTDAEWRDCMALGGAGWVRRMIASCTKSARAA